MTTALPPTLAGNRITSGRVTISQWGRWYADFAIDGEITLTGNVSAIINDLTLVGTILSGGPATGRSFFRVVSGFGGWGQTLKKKSYANDAGVKIKTIVSDAAAEVGEQIDLTTIDPSASVGTSFARPAEPACRVLEQIAPSGWYVGADGITRLGRRPQTQPSVAFTVTTPIDRAAGEIEIATETIATIVPGLMIDGLETIDVVHEIAEGKLRSSLYGQRSISNASRRLDAFRAVIDQLDPNRKFRAPWEYRVVTLSGNRCNLQPILVSSGMPDLQNVFVRPGLAGSKSTLALGSRVVVQFLSGAPNGAFISHEEDPDGSGFLPVLTSIDAQTLVKLGAGALPVARTGDLAGPFPLITTQVKVLA